LSPGDVRLQPEVQALDALPSGPHVAGRFYKLNLEFQRVQYLAERSSIAINVAGQYASKNLVSAEKFYLGGPQGVVGYPIGEGTGDQGFTFALEYRYLTGWRIADEGVSLTAFYNNGWVQRDRVRNSTTLNTATTDNSVVLDSVGIGALFGAEGNYVATFALAARLGGPVPSSGNPNSRGRLWFSLQKWF
jgi:hemolysin activation/secretion protein